MDMGSAQNCGWLMDYMDEVQATDFIWPPQIISDETVSSVNIGFGVSQRDETYPENSCSKKRLLWRELLPKNVKCQKSDHTYRFPSTRKRSYHMFQRRARVESCTGPGSKACREKMRRDRLNDRFLELCSILEPGRPPKTDKIVILSDATHRLNQLRLETQKLKETNVALQDTIKNLKAEKMELREEKVRLKAEKVKMEQTMKGMSMPSPFVPHPAFHASAAAAAFAANGKTMPYHVNYPPAMAMWQWMTPASLDTSQDHVLRPPVA